MISGQLRTGDLGVFDRRETAAIRAPCGIGNRRSDSACVARARIGRGLRNDDGFAVRRRVVPRSPPTANSIKVRRSPS